MIPNTRRKIRTSNMRAIMPMTSAEPRNFSLIKAHRIQQSDLTPQTISDATECASISTLPGSSRRFKGDALPLFTELPRRRAFAETRFPANDILGNSREERPIIRGPILCPRPYKNLCHCTLTLAHSLLKPLAHRPGPLNHFTCRYQRLYLNLY